MLSGKIHSIINAGCSYHFDEDTNRKIRVVNLFSAMGITISLLLGTRAMVANEVQLGTILLSATLVFATSHQVQVWFRNKLGQTVSVSLLLSGLMALMLLLVVTGGKSNTGPLWIYIVPPVAMFFTGVKLGLLTIFGFTLLLAVILFFPQDHLLLTSYSFEFKTRLLYSFATVTVLSAFYEFSRQQTFEVVKRLSAQFERQALHDSLTHLPNRRAAQQYLQREIARMKRNGRPLTVIIADIDHFKQVNDRYGHANGDTVLQSVSTTIKQHLRAQDIVARWGGEEFLIILPETAQDNAVILAEKLRRALEMKGIAIESEEIKVSASFGACEVNEDVSLHRALTLADQALYEAKQAGRNRVVPAHQVND